MSMLNDNKVELARFPASMAQREIWSAIQFGAEAHCAYNLSLWLELEGPLDRSALEKALQVVVERHDALRIIFDDDGRTFRVGQYCPSCLTYLDFSDQEEVKQQSTLLELEQRDADTPFNLVRGPLVRIHLVKLTERKNRLLFTSHAIVCDDWSIRIVFQELAQLYNAKHQGVVLVFPPAVQFSSYVAKENQDGESPAFKRSRAYWIKRLTPVPDPLDIPSWKSRPRTRTFASRHSILTLDNALTDKAQLFADRHNLSMGQLFLSVLAIYFYRICRQDDIVIGMVAPGRRSDEQHVGPYAVLLPLCFHIVPETSFNAYVDQCNLMFSEALEYQQVTYATLVRDLKLSGDSGRPLLFSTLFHTESLVESVNFSGLKSSVSIPPGSSENFDLVFHFVSRGKAAEIQCRYNRATFDDAIISLHLESFLALLTNALDNPAVPVKALALVSSEERRLQLEIFNDTNLVLPSAPTILNLFTDMVRNHADKDAIVFKNFSLSYAELHRQSDLLATKLIANGAGKNTLVAIHLHRSHKMFIAILGVLKSGAGYVPLDPSFPHDRLQYMVEDSQPVALITESGLPEIFYELPVLTIDIDQALTDAPSVAVSLPDDCVPGRQDIAYVIYTSGSTGKPKGVAVPHLGLLNLLVSMRELPGMQESDRLLAVTTLSFDMAVPELYLPLITGATIFMAGREDVIDGSCLKSLLEAHDITFFQATPSTWRMLLAAGWQGNPGMKGLIGGEALPLTLAHELVPRLQELWNMYGPTETTVWSTAWQVPPDTLQILVGRPIANTQLYVLDERRQLLPRGVPGELYIGGAGVTRGYLNRDELTAGVFIQNPLVPEELDIIYRTGDLVRYHASGELEYISRLDHQVKLRGYRIELGEIETAITRVTGRKEVVVNIFSMSEDDQRLVAYIKKEGDIDQESLDRELRAVLPAYMIPQHYMLLDAFPLTVNGKIDRKALPRPEREESPQSGLVEPRNDFEYSLLEVWKRILKVDHIGITDNFFDLGGHSLLALTLVNEMKKATGIEIEYGAVFSTPTIKDIVENLGEAISKQASSVVALQPEGDGIPIFCLCGINLYQELAVSLGKEQPVYAVYVDEEQALLEQAAQGRVADVSVEKLAQAYLKAIDRQQPEGPYQLIGISFGGIVAVETARLLQNAGKEVRIVVLLDTILPRGRKKKIIGVLKHHLYKIGREGLGYLFSRSKQKVRKTLYRHPWMVRKGGKKDNKDIKNDKIVQFRELAYLQAMDDYQGSIKPFSGDVVLFRAHDKWGDNSFFEYRHDYGWGEHVQGSLTILDASGDHLGIISKPHVQALAEQLRPLFMCHE